LKKESQPPRRSAAQGRGFVLSKATQHLPLKQPGENIADLGGLTLALDAYRASLKGQPAPVLDGYSGEQRVFLGWAQAWRGKVTDDYVRKQVVSDPHSPRQFRVIGPARNVDAWYDVFKVQPRDKMFIAPDQRVRIW